MAFSFLSGGDRFSSMPEVGSTKVISSGKDLGAAVFMREKNPDVYFRVSPNVNYLG